MEFKEIQDFDDLVCWMAEKTDSPRDYTEAFLFVWIAFILGGIGFLYVSVGQALGYSPIISLGVGFAVPIFLVSNIRMAWGAVKLHRREKEEAKSRETRADFASVWVCAAAEVEKAFSSFGKAVQAFIQGDDLVENAFRDMLGSSHAQEKMVRCLRKIGQLSEAESNALIEKLEEIREILAARQKAG